MNEADIVKIEDYVGLTVPESYRQLLLDYPEPLASLRWSGIRPTSFELFNKSKKILQENKFVRSSTFNMEDDSGETHTWPNHFLVIGESGGGDYYAINLKNKKAAVYFWDHETGGGFAKHAPSLREHIRKIFDQYFELATDKLS